MKAIRFPLMSQREFASVVPDCNILTMKEVGDMIKYYNGVLTTLVPFIELSRFGPLQYVTRFGKAQPPRERSSVSEDLYSICVSTSKTIFLHGVRLFGREGGSYKVDVDVAEDMKFSPSLVKQLGTYVSEKSEHANYYLFDVLFDEPVCLENGKTYKIISSIHGHSMARISCLREEICQSSWSCFYLHKKRGWCFFLL